MAASAIARYRSWLTRGVEAAAFVPFLFPGLLLGIPTFVICVTLNISTASYGLIATQAVLVIPFVCRFAAANLRAIPRNLESASLSLGAGQAYTWRRVYLPLLLPALSAADVIGFLRAFDETDSALFLVQPPDSTTLPVALFTEIQVNSSPLPVAVGGLLTVGIAILVIVVDRFTGVLSILLEGRQRSLQRST